MLIDAINRLFELGKQSERFQIIAKPGDNHASLIHFPGQTSMEEITHEAEPIDAVVTDLSTLQKTIAELEDDGCEIWVEESEIVVILDANGYRESRIRMPLHKSAMFQHLQRAWVFKKPMEFRKWLYEKCGNVTIDPPNFEALLSELRFRTEDEMSQSANKTNDTMGREIRAQVLGADGIPDSVVFSFLPFPTIDEEYQQEVSIPCRILIDVQERTVNLYPIEGMVHQTINLAVRRLVEQIESEFDMVVFAGSP